jgi:phosphoribosylaminoimidazolecarboxamide formyltransferase/IMP cyclohydrolase
MKSNTPKALISVWYKDGITELADALIKAGYEILSSSGTASHLRENSIEVTEIRDITGIPSILGGRVKTLHPSIMGGILSRRGNDDDDRDRSKYEIPLIDVVVCNLYPFEETAENNENNIEELIEKIDIGGVSLIRAAAKNYKDVAVITEIDDYGLAITEIEKTGDIPLELREKLAIKAFRTTAYYDATVEKGLSRLLIEDDEDFPDVINIPIKKQQSLRYGENPFQQASLYMPALSCGNSPFIQLWGRELSYNNIMDLNAILNAADMFSDSLTSIIIKHTTPCGIGTAKQLDIAYEKSLACDPVSAFGGIVGFTDVVDIKTAELLNRHFFEVVAAPDFDSESLELLKTKANIRLLQLTDKYKNKEQVIGCKAGFLMQQDILPSLISKDNCRWIGKPKYELWEDIVFAWKCAWLTKSNAITIVKDGATVGIGGGFTNRVDAARFALSRAGKNAKDAIMGSDAFFPFPDTVELAHASGISVIVQPGGSLKDTEVEKRAEELGITMLIAGTRTFRH